MPGFFIFWELLTEHSFFKINEQHLRKAFGMSYKIKLQPEINDPFILSQAASASRDGNIFKSPTGRDLCGETGGEAALGGLLKIHT